MCEDREKVYARYSLKKLFDDYSSVLGREVSMDLNKMLRETLKLPINLTEKNIDPASVFSVGSIFRPRTISSQTSLSPF